MTNIIDVSKILDGGFEGKKVCVHGWVQEKKVTDKTQSLLLRDGTGVILCTLKRDKPGPKVFMSINGLPVESTIELNGVVKEKLRVQGGYEVSVCDIKVVQKAEEDFPLIKKQYTFKFLLNHRHLQLRNRKFWAILRVRAILFEAARDWFKQNGYTEVQGPTLVPVGSENVTFEVKYFNKKVYLTQGFHAYAEAIIPSLGSVYTIAPSFRAEKSMTKRHLTEYWQIEGEAPWCDLQEILRVQEGLITHICQVLCNKASKELECLGRDIKDLLKVRAPFPKLTYDEVVKQLKEEGFDIIWGENVTWKQEKHLSLKFDRPFFVTHYPMGIQRLFRKSHPKKPELTLSADLLAPEGYGEISGCGQRIDNLEELMKKMKMENMDPKEFQWIIDLKKYGSVPHSGFAIGVERLVTWICKLQHIGEAIAFPRFRSRIYP